MRLLNYTVKQTGERRFGVASGAGIVDLYGRIGAKNSSIKSILNPEVLNGLEEFSNLSPDYLPDEVEFLPVIDRPNKIFCVGMNYADKRVEFGETNNAPTLFVRFSDSQTGHNCPVMMPTETNEFDYEGELAVIIGKACERISPEDAMDYVAGYSCYMDGSVRDWQHTWFTAGKNWPKTGSFGPWMVTSDEISDPHSLRIRTYLNGSVVQDDNTGNMIHKIPDLISYISTFSALSPGDVIITGSPGGVGKKRNPPLFLKDGDKIQVEIDKIGLLSNVVSLAQ